MQHTRCAAFMYHNDNKLFFDYIRESFPENIVKFDFQQQSQLDRIDYRNDLKYQLRWR